MGPYVSQHPDQYVGQHLGMTHQCTDFVKVASGAPPASLWHKGDVVHGNMTIAVGTAIACGWEGNHYPSKPPGTTRRSTWASTVTTSRSTTSRLRSSSACARSTTPRRTRTTSFCSSAIDRGASTVRR